MEECRAARRKSISRGSLTIKGDTDLAAVLLLEVVAICLDCGTMGKKHEAGAGSIYRFFKGELLRLYSGITIPNAIANC